MNFSKPVRFILCIVPFQYDWYDKIAPYLTSQNATSVGIVGTCWGSYLVMHASVDPLVRAGVSVHPAHDIIMADLGEAEGPLYLDVNANGAAQYLGPTPDAGDNLRPGGLADVSIELVNIRTRLTNISLPFFLCQETAITFSV